MTEREPQPPASIHSSPGLDPTPIANLSSSNRTRIRSSTYPGQSLQSSREHNGSVRRQSKITEADYLSRLSDHYKKTSENALYLGENFHKLVSFLDEADPPTWEKAVYKAADPCYATLYLLQVEGLPSGAKDVYSEDFKQMDDLIRLDETLGIGSDGRVGNQLLFLRGFPSPQWLRKLGSHYVIDPEFFRRHLDMSLLSHQQWFSSPSLPSTSTTIIQLRVTTLARRSPGVADVDLARKIAQEEMAMYIPSMSGRVLNGDLGESIVRRMSLHDERYFSLEQDISIHCCKRGKSWTVVIWFDSGKDLDRGRQGPWGKGFELISTIRNEPNRAVHASESKTRNENLKIRAKEFQQSRALLNLDYERLLEDFDNLDDAFYSIIPIFKYKATAENQFLNLVESVLQRSMEGIRFTKSAVDSADKESQYFVDLGKYHANFIYHKELLESHLRSLADNIRWIKARGGPSWPSSKSQKVKDAVETLHEDFEWLRVRAKSLSKLCDRAMQDIHDKSTLAEAWKANEQAQQVNRLTKLANFMSVFYIPLSFTSGFFGMNFSVFGQGNAPLWLYPLISLPILAFSVLFMYSQHIWKALRVSEERSQPRKKVYAVNDAQSFTQV